MILGVVDDVLERPTSQKLGLIAGLIVVITILDWQYFYGSRAHHLSELQDQVAQRQVEFDTKRNRANARADAERDIRDLNAELRRAQARLPDQREIADLLSSIAASGRTAGLDITLFRQKPETYQDFYAEVPVQMEMRGTFHDVALFLDRVKRLDRIVNVSNIKLAKPRQDGERILLDASCTATTFRFLDEAERQRVQEQQKKSNGGKGA
jgi:type IV pilus assembly protein PilO